MGQHLRCGLGGYLSTFHLTNVITSCTRPYCRSREKFVRKISNHRGILGCIFAFCLLANCGSVVLGPQLRDVCGLWLPADIDGLAPNVTVAWVPAWVCTTHASKITCLGAFRFVWFVGRNVDSRFDSNVTLRKAATHQNVLKVCRVKARRLTSGHLNAPGS